MFNLYLEEIKKKYSNYKWRQLSKDESGIQAIVHKGVLEKDGLVKTRFLKKDFLDQKEAFREIIAYHIIEYVNKAYLASGFNTKAMPIPLDFDWEVDNNRIELSTSSVNTASENDVNLDIKDSLITHKYIYTNALIGNADTHEGNVVYKSRGRNYAIDFGYAFYDSREYSKALTNLKDSMDDILLDEPSKKNIIYMQKNIFFWNNFLRKNKGVLVNLFKTTGNKIIAGFDRPERKQDLIEEFDFMKPDFSENIDKLESIYSEYFKKTEAAYKEVK